MNISKIVNGIFIVSLVVFSILPCRADMVPNNTEELPRLAIGLYQMDKHLAVYSKPDFSSKIRFERDIDYPKLTDVKTDNLYAILISSKELGYLYVTDISDDEEWLEVIINKQTNQKGWVHKNDEFQFLSWIDFIDLYGRKYGLKRLLSNDINIMGIYSNPSDNAQIISDLTNPKSIKLISVEGEWVLVTVLDFSGNVTTGYIKWKADNGDIRIFPIVK